MVPKERRSSTMTKISILYPNREGSTFDMNYYLHTHMPMSIERLRSAKGFRGASVERGVSGAVPGSAPAYVAMCHFLFDSVGDFLTAFTPHASVLQGDMANYTDVEPTIQVNEVAIAQ
jgi:uncharacterized protein (TIGR02118 family)